MITGCGPPLLLLAACGTVLPVLGGLFSAAAANWSRDGMNYSAMLEDAIRVVQGNRREPTPVTTEARTAPLLALEIALLQQIERDGDVVVQPITEGSVLYHRGDLANSDRFKVFVRPDQACFVYVLSLDSTGWLQVLFPADGRGQQLASGSELFLPPSPDIDMSYAVDRFGGLETLYFIASRDRNLELERALEPFIGLERHPIDDPAAVADLGDAHVVRGIASRGVPGHATVQTRAGERGFATEVLRVAAQGELVLTRTFRHEVAR
jgi:hypothetical protein